MEFTHEELRSDVVFYIPDMLRLGLLSENQFYRFDPTTNGYIRCTPQEWQNEMILFLVLT